MLHLGFAFLAAFAASIIFHRSAPLETPDGLTLENMPQSSMVQGESEDWDTTLQIPDDAESDVNVIIEKPVSVCEEPVVYEAYPPPETVVLQYVGTDLEKDLSLLQGDKIIFVAVAPSWSFHYRQTESLLKRLIDRLNQKRKASYEEYLKTRDPHLDTAFEPPNITMTHFALLKAEASIRLMEDLGVTKYPSWRVLSRKNLTHESPSPKTIDEKVSCFSASYLDDIQMDKSATLGYFTVICSEDYAKHVKNDSITWFQVQVWLFLTAWRLWESFFSLYIKCLMDNANLCRYGSALSLLILMAGAGYSLSTRTHS